MLISRRRFLGLGVLATGATLFGAFHLRRSDARVLAMVYATVTGEEDPDSIRTALPTMDTFVGTLPSKDRFELGVALRLVEYAPLVSEGGRFSQLPLPARIRCLEAWRNGANWRKPVFAGLRELSYFAYYTQPSHWLKIGYTGPLVGMAAEVQDWDPRYAKLVAPL